MQTINHDVLVNASYVGNIGEIGSEYVHFAHSTCTSVFCGNVEYVVDGWIVVVFIDCNDWDYVDSVVAPDGRKGEFEDWFGDKDKDGNCECRQPDDLLNAEDSACYLRMVDAFEEAT